MPWRQTKNPYRIWVSEIMLQQTQVGTVTPYYRNWIREFPTVKSVSVAPLERVFKLWEGLGYYTRARNIHRAARQIMENEKGRFPSSLEEIRKLPGIGPYTAGAIASIAFGIRTPLLDGNVMRVLTRIFAIASPVDSSRTRQSLWKLAEELVPESNPGDFNQALMELGATVCLARTPLCMKCPVSSDCAAFSKNKQDRFPVKNRKQITKKVTAVCAILRCRKRILAERRPETGLWAGLWQLPTFKTEGQKKVEQALKGGLDKLGIGVSGIKKTGEIERSYTSHRETLHVFSAQTAEPCGTYGKNLKWVSRKRLNALPFSAAYKKIIDKHLTT